MLSNRIWISQFIRGITRGHFSLMEHKTPDFLSANLSILESKAKSNGRQWIWILLLIFPGGNSIFKTNTHAGTNFFCFFIQFTHSFKRIKNGYQTHAISGTIWAACGAVPAIKPWMGKCTLAWHQSLLKLDLLGPVVELLLLVADREWFPSRWKGHFKEDCYLQSCTFQGYQVHTFAAVWLYP